MTTTETSAPSSSRCPTPSWRRSPWPPIPTSSRTRGAVPWTGGSAAGPQLLPEWYMPTAVARRRGRRTRWVVLVVVGAILAINAAGLCVTYGWPG